MSNNSSITGLTTEILLADLDSNTNELLQTIAAFTNEQFNVVPYKGSWTAGQVAEHLLKAESGIPVVLKGNSKSTERPADEKMETIRSIFLDFDTKMESPDFILPSEEPKEKEIFLDGFQKNRIAVKELAGCIDLSRSFTDFPFPGIDVLTGMEWLFFMTCHSKRHTRQLKNIYTIVNKGE
jgi:hypothetical protein